MVQLYNFSGSWQLFPEKGTYEKGNRPKSGFYKIESLDSAKGLSISHSWVSLENEAFTSDYKVLATGEKEAFNELSFADEVQVIFKDALQFEVHFYTGGDRKLTITHSLQPNGYLKVEQQGSEESGGSYTNTEVFHRQMNVLPYSASVSGVAIKATKEGVIRHKALTAMEEQTNMQLDQIRKQVELLALQAQEIHKRKELSMLIYGAKLSFKPEIGQVYYLYEKADASHVISLISPKEWGPSMPYASFIAAVQLLADHTWKEL
ncbi:MAG TPA: DUF2452 domain-containing protein [Flavisolibacter sp.]|jgi:hypothetical protein|nr:DUF2452 domain-containing protein [Flavisolibacter sp.]